MAENPAAIFQSLLATTHILIGHLSESDEEHSQSAVTVLLMQAFRSLGPESVAMKQFFPVLDAIKRRLDASDFGGALKQARLFGAQLQEIIDLVNAGRSQAEEHAPSSPSSSEPIDLSFRPKSYFWPNGLEKGVLNLIKGTQRRAALQRLIDAGQLDEIPSFLTKADLTAEERKALGKIHPMFMGGEYLPDKALDEVEIARIEINSTTFDVTSVYAQRTRSGFSYRVVDEYEGSTLTGDATRESAEPLTLGELEDFFMGAWSLMEVLEANFEGDLEQMLGFFRATSSFYPDLDRLLRQRVSEDYSDDDELDPEDDEEADDS